MNDLTGAGRVGALQEGLDLLESLPPAGPVLREQGYTSDADLLRGLDADDPTVRRGCLELLAEARGGRPDAAVERVVARLDDPAWEVRYTALHALTCTSDAADPRVLPAAVRVVADDGSRYVRMLAAELLGAAAPADPTAATALRRARDSDPDAAVRRKAGRYAR